MPKKKQMVGLHINGHLEIFEIEKIIRLKAEGNYTEVFLEGKTKALTCHTLAYCAKLLKGHDFFRAHASHLININKVAKYENGSNATITMRDGEKIQLARRHKKGFKSAYIIL